MWPDWVSNPGPLALESDALPTALCCLASLFAQVFFQNKRGNIKQKLQYELTHHLNCTEIQY